MPLGNLQQSQVYRNGGTFGGSAKQGSIYRVFNIYGDTQLGREIATRTLENILQFYYGVGYQYHFYGTSVQDGLITKSFVDRYNYLVNTLSLSQAAAIAQIEASGSVNVSFVKTENPRYQYPEGYVEFRIKPYDTTDRHEFIPLGLQNLKYKGCKLIATGINANSTQTIDGGPVIKVTRVNQNQIVFSNNTVTTARANTSGLPVRQLTSRDFAAGTGKVSETITTIPNTQV